MSFLKNLFGGGNGGGGGSSDKAPSPVVTSSANNTINSIQRLTDQEEQLEKRRALLEKKIEAEVDKAKGYMKQQKKTLALQCMKKKKLLEGQMENLNNMIMRIIEQRMMLENQRTVTETVKSMHDAAKTAKENLKAVKIDNVDKVVEEIEEANDQMRQLNEVFAQPTGMAADLDEDELLAELEEMEGMQLEEELLQPAPVPVTKHQLPSVPQKAVKVSAKTKEEEELEALQAELAL